MKGTTILIFIIFVLIVLSLEFFIGYGFWKLVKLIIPDNLILDISLTVIIEIILILFQLRTLLLFCIYEWQFPSQKISIHLEQTPFAKARLTNLIKMKNILDSLMDMSSLSKKQIDILKMCIYECNSQMNVFSKITKSKPQMKFYTALTIFDNEISKCNFKSYLISLNTVSRTFDIRKFIWKVKKTNSPMTNAYILMNLKRIRLAVDVLIKEYENYLCERSYLESFEKLKCLFFNDCFSSIDKLHEEFLINFEGFEVEENTTSNGINWVIISDEQSSENKAVIMCGPNGGPFELTSSSKIMFYLEKKFDVILWNYRGFGKSKGRTCFNRAKNDALLIYEEVKKRNYEKIIVYGYSIGGVAASHIAVNKNIDLLVLDRTFSSIKSIAESYKCGKVLSFLFRCLLVFSDNIESNIEKATCEKIILFSPTDQIIPNNGNVYNYISKLIVKKHIENGSESGFILDTIFNNNNNNKSLFINGWKNIVIHVSRHSENIKDKNINYIREGEEGESESISFMPIIYSGPNESISSENIQNKLNTYKITPKTIHDFIELELYRFVECFKFCSPNKIDYFYTSNIAGSNRRTEMYINNFFNNLVVHGTMKPTREIEIYDSYDNKHHLKFSNENAEQVLLSALEHLEFINRTVQKVVPELDTVIYKEIESFLPLYKEFVEGVLNLKVKTHRILIEEESCKESLIEKDDGNMSNSKGSYAKEMEQLNYLKGKLILLDTNHNGLLSKIERDLYSDYLTEAKV